MQPLRAVGADPFSSVVVDQLALGWELPTDADFEVLQDLDLFNDAWDPDHGFSGFSEPISSGASAGAVAPNPAMVRSGSEDSSATASLLNLGTYAGHAQEASNPAAAALVSPASALVPLQVSQPGLLSGVLHQPEVQPAAAPQAVLPADESGMCACCQQLLPAGAQLSADIKAGVSTADVRFRAARLTLQAAICCSKRGPTVKPCLFSTMEQLASGREWGITESKARSAEPGLKRQRNGAPAWNVNFNSNSPLLLTGQQELQVLSYSSSSNSNSGGGGADAAGELYSVRSTDGSKIAYAVACRDTATADAAGAVGSNGEQPLTGSLPSSSSSSTDLWCNTLQCNKKKHPLRGQALRLFRYAFVVYNSDKVMAAKRSKGS